MKHRKFGSLGWEASILGLGIARLPFTAEDSESFDAAASIELIRYAIDCGVNYLDLGYPYDMQRQERIARIVREALQDGYLKKVRIFITLPPHLIRTVEDFDFYLGKQLDWLRIAKADFCMLGRLNRENWPILRALGALNWAEKALEAGRFENIGFSFHDHFQILKAVLAACDRWAFCQFQFSYMDVDHDPGISGIKYAAEKGLAVIATEPLRSGRLTKPPLASVAGIWAEAGELNHLTDLGLRFIWSYPEIATATCDVGSLYEVSEAAAIADHAEANSLTIREEILIGRVRDEYRKLKRIPCSSCRPCMPCPEEIDVPRIFELYNDSFIYGNAETARSIYRSELHDIKLCTRCRLCEERCVKKLPIMKWLDQALLLLD